MTRWLRDAIDPPDAVQARVALGHAPRARPFEPMPFDWTVLCAWMVACTIGAAAYDQEVRAWQAFRALWLAEPGRHGHLMFPALASGARQVTIVGLAIAAQAVVLRRSLRFAEWWLLGTVAILPLQLPIVASAQYLGLGTALAQYLVLPGVALAQYLVLRANRLPRAGWWILACPVLLGGSLLLREAAGTAVPPGTFGAIGGLATGCVLAWILRTRASDGQRPVVEPPADPAPPAPSARRWRAGRPRRTGIGSDGPAGTPARAHGG